MAMTAREKLAVGRMILKEDSRAPYLAAAVDALVPHEVAGLGTIGVTETGILVWDPVRVAEWTVEEIATVLEHEVWHLLRRHGERCKEMGAIPALWNIAGDCEINDDLKAAGLNLPKFHNPQNPDQPGEACYPSSYGMADGLLAEEYYHALRKQAREELEKMGICPDCANGTHQPGSEPGAEPRIVREGEEPGDGEGGGDAEGQGKGTKKPGKGKGGGKAPPTGDRQHVGHGWCGSGAGRKMPQEPGGGSGGKGSGQSDGPGGEGEVEGRTPGELAQVRAQVAEAAKAQASRGRSNMPSNVLRWADDTLKPAKIPWQQKLARAARGCVAFRPGAQDYHYNRPSRRQGALGYGMGSPVLPAMREPVPEVLVITDTSGSMGAEEIRTAVSETAGILKATTAKVRFMANDADVHALREVRVWQDCLKLVVGGGGTDFRPPFRAIQKAKLKPDVVVFITDGMGPCPVYAPPKMHVIWLLVGPSRQRPYMVPDEDTTGWGGGSNAPLDWGTVIEVDDTPTAAEQKELDEAA